MDLKASSKTNSREKNKRRHSETSSDRRSHRDGTNERQEGPAPIPGQSLGGANLAHRTCTCASGG